MKECGIRIWKDLQSCLYIQQIYNSLQEINLWQQMQNHSLLLVVKVFMSRAVSQLYEDQTFINQEAEPKQDDAFLFASSVCPANTIVSLPNFNCYAYCSWDTCVASLLALSQAGNDSTFLFCNVRSNSCEVTDL